MERFLKYCLLLLFLIYVRTTWAEYRVEIDTLTDMERYGDQGVCTAYGFWEDITCKYDHPSSSSEGFWSSCDLGNCELKINIGSLGGGHYWKPSKLEILSFVHGSNSEIRARYQLVPGGTIANINPMIGPAPGWVNNELNLNPNLAWTEESVLLIRLFSSPFNDQIDIVDKIVVEFLAPSTSEPSTIEPAEPSTIEPVEPSTLPGDRTTPSGPESTRPGEHETTETPAPYCDEDLDHDSGYFQSPYYPKNYPNGADCTIRFAAPSDKVIQISFIGPLDIESDKNCAYDYLEFRDGPFPHSSLISRICGHQQNPQTVTSTSNYLYARFHSDDSQNYQGFAANYTRVDRDCNCNCNI
jgi:hypothetical protein